MPCLSSTTHWGLTFAVDFVRLGAALYQVRSRSSLYHLDPTGAVRGWAIRISESANGTAVSRTDHTLPASHRPDRMLRTLREENDEAPPRTRPSRTRPPFVMLVETTHGPFRAIRRTIALLALVLRGRVFPPADDGTGASSDDHRLHTCQPGPVCSTGWEYTYRAVLTNPGVRARECDGDGR
jgi:hypothetical protein